MVDKLLQERETLGCPIRVAMVGAGVTGRMIALQLCTPVPGIRLVAIANRTIDKARTAYANAEVTAVKAVGSVEALEERIDEGQCSIAEDASLLCRATNVDLI